MFHGALLAENPFAHEPTVNAYEAATFTRSAAEAADGTLLLDTTPVRWSSRHPQHPAVGS